MMRLNDPPLALEEAGDAGAPLLVFLHGVGGSRHNWAPQLAHFGGRFHALAWDARGYGDSIGTPVRCFTDFADDLAAVIGHFGGRNGSGAHLVGLSMGGRIALDCWRRYPGLVASLTLADTSAGAAPPPDKVAAFMALRRKPLEEGRTMAEIAPGIVDSIAGPGISAEVRAALLASHSALDPVTYLATLEAVTAFSDFPPLAGISVPVLVMAGEHDPIATPAFASGMAAAIPGARFEMIAGAGHVSNLEAPELFNAALDAFLAEAA
ncbi:pimeloyl-ACP methyl ester carboxylesterase [Polymorphobacter multimanifer]|uniref:Pimeloyl-ACP methyl ester carboxylesterase n=2 Tax=Polymorphobacter multimanifer TaxID=1070431 RepID=A0A841LFH7_9SPHN|nr:alpha/beta fold hydrolase [Polymorphobacter multimanifer]MBB6227922.1 pimeloyl-ACP methyl ester carboxylesterase [Polymorphobacter multimanifer]